MPSHKIHIKMGEEINKKLRLNEDLFKIGCVLPDLIKNIPHYKSHFKTDLTNHLFYNKELFIEKYLKDNNPVIIGYLVHILTDEFYNKYVRDNYYLFDKNHKLNGIKLKNKKIYGTPEIITKIKQEEFTMYDYYLIKNKMLNMFVNFDIINQLPKIIECDYDKNYIIDYMNNYNKEISGNNYNKNINYKFLSQDELEFVFKECKNYILKYLKDIFDKKTL